MKDIVIIANFCRDFSETDNGRFIYLCKELSIDNKVEIITSDFGHTTKKHKDQLVHNWPFTITFLHEPGYKKNVSIQRFISHYAWGKEVQKYIKKRKKPDVVYCAVPSLTAPYEIAKYCERNEIRFIIDIQDLWPEAFQMVFDVPIFSDLVFAPIKHRANEIYKRADVVCGVSETYVNRALMVNRKNKTGHVVYLGTSLKTFDKNANESIPLIKKELKNDIWLGYCGSLSASYDIATVIQALKIIKDSGKYVPKFIVMGDGAKRREFANEAKKLQVDVVFLGKLPYEKMCAQLMECDIVVNPIVGKSAASIINKHGDYAASGKPVINTQDSKEYKKLIKSYNMGLNCNNGDSNSLANKILELVEDKQLRVLMGENSRKCAKEKFDRDKTYIELIDQIIGE